MMQGQTKIKYTCECLTYISVTVFFLRSTKPPDWLEEKICRFLCYRYLSGHFCKTFNSRMSVPFQTHPEEAEGTLKRFLFMQLHSIISTVSSCLSSPLFQAMGLVQCKGLFEVCDICNLTFIFFGIVQTKHSLKEHCSLSAKYIPKGKDKGPNATHHWNTQRRIRSTWVLISP